MQRIWLERDVPKRAAARIVLGLEIALKNQPVVAGDDDAMEVPNALVCDGRVASRVEIGREACFAGDDGRQPRGGGGQRSSLRCEYGSHADYDLAATCHW